MSIFSKGANWEATRASDLEKSRKLAWMFAGLMGFCLVVAVIALAMLTPLRRTVPYVVKQDAQTGNLEVLQSFDNRVIGTQEVLNKYWARRYVVSREQYNWWLVGSDYDNVVALTDPSIFPEYGSQFLGEKGLDKVFGDFTERRIKVLSIAPAPTNAQQMVVRFERTTVSKGNVVEAPTVFVVNMTFRYTPNNYASEAELIRNPMGFQVFSYRRDVEVPSSGVPGVTNEAMSAGG
ncbi:type IV secretion system protein VirB8 [Rhodoferax ferrireducens]|uniref:Type IV secretion system protein VirB8 n=1 Tax=Rhodoferax ferrireducens TaxID=192843 RepID=A0ABU2CGJ6_9BURK|nr:type IV secretion system protein [Rhodoferax ferrireducens]MDR7380428.1 type IV secretion system protein VirB8 [Rhodoferax ferrireducens]